METMVYGGTVILGALYLFIPQQFMDWLGKLRDKEIDTSLPHLVLMRLSGAGAVAYGGYHLIHH